MDWKSIFPREKPVEEIPEAEPSRPAPEPDSAGAPKAVELSPALAAARPGGNPDLEEKVVDVLKTCFDPEIPVNIYELGLIYEIRSGDDGAVHLKMTLTSPMCPVAGSLPPEVESKVRALPSTGEVRVDLVWDPPWDPSRMTEAARLQLNMF